MDSSLWKPTHQTILAALQMTKVSFLGAKLVQPLPRYVCLTSVFF
jgi:hypothetical protein